MYQFFVEPHQVGQEYISIFGDDVNHIKNVLRMKIGTQIRVSVKETDIFKESYFGTIDQISENEVRVKIEAQDEIGTELSNRIYLFQGLPKSDKMELIIQKAVELGAYEIIPVAMKNCVAKLDEKKAASKIARWQEIAKSAAKQSKRSLIPTVQMPLSYKLAVQKAKELDVILVPYENERGMQATREVTEELSA